MLRITILYHVFLSLTAIYLLLKCRGRFFRWKFSFGALLGIFFAIVYAIIFGDITSIEIEALNNSSDHYEKMRMFSSLRLFAQGIFIEGAAFILGGALMILFDKKYIPTNVVRPQKNELNQNKLDQGHLNRNELDRNKTTLQKTSSSETGFNEGGSNEENRESGDFPDTRTRLRKSAFLLGAFLLIAITGIDAFWIEPHALQVKKLEITTERVTKPIRIVFMSDIETDCPDAYTRRILETMKAQQPDLFLFGGDYIQYSRSSIIKEGSLFAAYRPLLPRSRARDLRKEFNALLKEMNFHAPLGCFAVSGSPRDLRFEPLLFENTGITLETKTGTLSLGDDLYLTCLNPVDCQYSDQSEFLTADQRKENRFHIILGHIPDFVMNYPQTDLALAGHTHGGQIRLPLIGALTSQTLRFPRKWASGHRVITSPDGKNQFDLIVSNGAGLEAGGSPRMRLLCRPDIWVIDLKPKSPSGQ